MVLAWAAAVMLPAFLRLPGRKAADRCFWSSRPCDQPGMQMAESAGLYVGAASL